jgi:hypothetical protein
MNFFRLHFGQTGLRSKQPFFDIPRPMHPLLFVLVVSTVSTPLLAAPCRIVATSSFEEPVVSGPTPLAGGGDPTRCSEEPGQKPLWESIEDKPNLGEYGAIVAGLTNQAAHSGHQCLFIKATKLSAPYLGVQWTSRHIRIEARKSYRMTLWGRLAPTVPALPERCPTATAPLYLNIQVCFFCNESEGKFRETGDSLYTVLPLQKAHNDGPGLNSKEWIPLSSVFEVPEETTTLAVNFRCDSRAAKGSANATIYLDDFTLAEEPASSGDATVASRRPRKPRKAICTNHSRLRHICLPLAEN